MNKKYSEDEDALIVGEIQSFLQEKRTALKTIRIGTAVIVAVISLIGFLIATLGPMLSFRRGIGWVYWLPLV
jgi:uncharacterized membrane-anchored protein